MKPEMMKPEKISGYDRYKVEDGGRTLRRAEEIKSDPKFLKVVLSNMDKEADETEKTVSIIRKTTNKLRDIFKSK